MTYTVAFILEQALGHITHSQNLIRHVEESATVRALWGLPAFDVAGFARHIPVYRSNWTVRSGWQARRLLSGITQQEKPDVLFFHTQVPATLAQDWIARIPTVVSLDATPTQYDELGAAYGHHRGAELLERLKWKINQQTFTKARHIVTWSSWAKDGVMSEYHVPSDKVSVIPPGVTVRDWAPPPNTTPHSGVRILFVGGDLTRKGGLTLIEAFRRLRAELATSVSQSTPPIELHLVTRNQIPEEPGIVVYNTMQPNSLELKKLYFESDIFCLPTQGDCLPMALAEAGAAKLPLVSTSVGAISEIVQEGKTGYLMAPGDVPALTGILHRLICDPAERRSLGEQAAALVKADHNAEVNASRLLNLLLDVANKSHQPGKAQ